MENFELTVERREPKGKGGARKLRARGLIPSIVYGPKCQPTAVACEMRELMRLLAEGRNILINLKIKDGTGRKGGSEHVVMLRELQVDPARGVPIHADLLEVSMKEVMTVEVPIRLVGKAEGTKVGGILEQVRRELEVECLPTDLPSQIEVDVSHLEIGDSIHVEDIQVEKARILTDLQVTIATVVPPVVEKEVVPEEVPVEAEEEGEIPAEAEAEGGEEEKKES
jgi:large subunit ribosomal protein L25